MAITPQLGSLETVRLIFATELENTHALETESLELLKRQVERIEHYPDLKEILRLHVLETQGQIRRLEEILTVIGYDRSRLKDIVAKIMGNLGVLKNVPVGDEILKDIFTDDAVENYEIAAYKALIAIAEAGGFLKHVPALRETLQEEEKTARLIYDQIEAVTHQYLRRESKGLRGDR